MLYALTEKVFMGAGAMADKDLEALLKQASEMVASGEDATGLFSAIEARVDRLELDLQAKQGQAELKQQRLEEVQFLARALAAQEEETARIADLGQRMDKLVPAIQETVGGYREAVATRNQLAPLMARLEQMVAGMGAASAAEPGPVLSTYFDAYVAKKKKEGWTNQTLKQDTGSINIFLELAGDKPVSAYIRADIEAFRETLERIPANHGKSSALRDLTIMEEIERADSAEDVVPRLAYKTLKRHWTGVKQFLEWASIHCPVGQKMDHDILKKHRWGTNVPKGDKRKIWTEEALSTLFRSPVYTGCAGAKRYQRWRAGREIIRDGYYWLPLLGMFTAAREEELARLRVQDIHAIEGVWIIDITMDGPGRLKGESAVRKVPLHKTLFEIGFLDYWQRIKEQGEDQLFPTFQPGGIDKKFSHDFCDFFTTYRRRIGVYERLMDFHSLRTTFSTLMLREDVKILVVDELTGHDSSLRKENRELQSETVASYYTGEELRKLKAAVDSFDPGVDLSHLVG